MNTMQYVMKAAMLADRDMIDRAIAVTFEGLARIEAGELEIDPEAVELKAMSAELLEAAGRDEEAIKASEELLKWCESLQDMDDLLAQAVETAKNILSSYGRAV